MINKFNNKIELKHLNKDEIKKIQDEIKNNIEKVNNRNKMYNVVSLGEILQNERNSGIFYNKLAKTLKNYKDINEIENISKECFNQVKILENIYFSKNNEKFKYKEVKIVNIKSIKEGLILAIEEELNSYDKICKILDEDISMGNELNKMCVKKLKIIMKLEFLLLKYIIE